MFVKRFILHFQRSLMILVIFVSSPIKYFSIQIYILLPKFKYTKCSPNSGNFFLCTGLWVVAYRAQAVTKRLENDKSLYKSAV